MKSIAILLVLLYAFFPKQASAQTDTASIAGTWQLISSKGSINNAVFDKDSSEVFMIKVLTTAMFFNTVYKKKSGRFDSAVQGTYLVAGNIYHETVMYSSVGDFPGHSFSYNYTVNGNILTISGESNGIKLIEQWKRIE